MAFLILIVSCFVAFIYSLHGEFWYLFPQNYTNPLKPSVATHLCKILELPERDVRCQGDEVYSFDFLMDLKYKFAPVPRDEIDNEIGAYLVECNDWILTASDGVNQGCTYDFSGDGVFTFIVAYTMDPNPDSRLEDEIRKNSTTPWNIKFADAYEKFPNRTSRICTYENYGILITIWVTLNCDFIRH